MGEIKTNNVNVPMNFYGVSLKEFENYNMAASVFANVRRAYFQTGNQQKNNFTQKTDNAVYKYNYHLWQKGIKWVVYKNKSVYQNIVNQPENKYYVQTFSDSGRIIKHEFFDENHNWLKTSYYNFSDETPICSVVPYMLEGKTALLRYNVGAKEPVVLFECEMPQTDEETLRMKEFESFVDAVVMDNSGVVYFAQKDKKEEYSSKLSEVKAKILQENVPQSFVSDADKKEGIRLRKEDFNLSRNLNETFHIDDSEVFGEAQRPLDFLNVDADTPDNAIDDVLLPDMILENDSVKDEEVSEKELEIQQEIENSDYFVSAEDTDDNSQESVSEQELAAQLIAEQAVGQIDTIISLTEEKTTDFEENEPDKVIDKEDNSYYYYGEKDENGNRCGYGRTLMKNGVTAYDGYYSNDMRNGFGCFNYKNGNFCYAGQWLDNKKNGLGVCRRDSDGVVQLGKWLNDEPVGVAARADDRGNITYVGKHKNGLRDGIGVTFDENSNPVVALWKDGTVVEILFKSENVGDING